jgi:hypothetical protein
MSIENNPPSSGEHVSADYLKTHNVDARRDDGWNVSKEEKDNILNGAPSKDVYFYDRETGKRYEFDPETGDYVNTAINGGSYDDQDFHPVGGGSDKSK